MVEDGALDAANREFPAPDAIAGRLRALGVSDDSRLVLWATRCSSLPTRIVLMLCGLDHVAGILDGGRKHWVASGHL